MPTNPNKETKWDLYPVKIYGINKIRKLKTYTCHTSLLLPAWELKGWGWKSETRKQKPRAAVSSFLYYGILELIWILNFFYPLALKFLLPVLLPHKLISPSSIFPTLTILILITPQLKAHFVCTPLSTLLF